MVQSFGSYEDTLTVAPGTSHAEVAAALPATLPATATSQAETSTENVVVTWMSSLTWDATTPGSYQLSATANGQRMPHGLCIFSSLITASFAWTSFSQSTYNEHSGAVDTTVQLLKLEKDANGTPAGRVLSGAEFYLYKLNTLQKKAVFNIVSDITPDKREELRQGTAMKWWALLGLNQ